MMGGEVKCLAVVTIMFFSLGFAQDVDKVTPPNVPSRWIDYKNNLCGDSNSVKINVEKVALGS